MNKNIFILAAVLLVAACNTSESDNSDPQGQGNTSDTGSSQADNNNTDTGGSETDTGGTGSESGGSGGDAGGSGGEGGGESDSISHADYYVGVEGLAGSELKSALHDIISTNTTTLTYSEVWTALQYTDEDPDNTNNVILIYTGRSADKEDRVGQAGDDNDSWNREHMWPKSLGFPNKNQYGYTDIHHLRPSDVTVNSARANKVFDNGGSANGEAPDTFTDSNSWEPRDAVKGDAARMMFYMDTRYDGSSGNMPDLMLVNNSNSTSGDPTMGVLCTLLEWHQADAVDEFETRRNNRIEEKQGNRNPFIDNPQWVESIWGSSCP